MTPLEIAVASMEMYQQTYPEDAYLLVTNTEEIIAVLRGKQIDFGLAPGTPLQQIAGTVTETAVRTGKKLQEERGPERFGIGYIATSTPVFHNGKVVGALSAIVSNDRFEKLRSSAVELAAMVEETTATTDEVANASSHITGVIQDIFDLSEQIATDVKKIGDITQFVKDIAAQSNLLGLNAAIEAARAGDHGRGFGIVADEIRKMAGQSSNSVKSINDLNNHIEHLIHSVHDLIQGAVADTEEHSASVQELKAVFDHIAATADGLINMAGV